MIERPVAAALLKRSRMLLIITIILLSVPLTAQASLRMILIDDLEAVVVKKLITMGFDIAAVRAMDASVGQAIADRGYRVEAVASETDLDKLNAMGVSWRFAQSAAAAKSSKGTPGSVYHSFDEPDIGMKARIYRVAEQYPDIARVKVFGHSINGRELLAVKLGSNRKHRNKKPEVLYVATHHAREWVAAQMGIRLVEYLAGNYGSDFRVTALLDDVDVWLVPIANPDGYEFTFTDERLWRKNLRDVNGDGVISNGDGIDLNRNFGSNWGLDDEGSSPVPNSETYRGTAAFSEPENAALRKLVRQHDFKFAISYHTYGNLILYPIGWQVKTPSFDDGIFVALAGVDGNASIFDSLLDQHYDPGVSADLYITNGDFTDWMYEKQRVPNFTVELTFGQDADGNLYGFEFPDDEEMVQTVFEDNLEFALAVAESAKDPAHPVSPVDMPAQDLYHTPLTTSWGDRQRFSVVARRQGKDPDLYYSVNGGKLRKADFDSKRGRFYNERKGIFYDRYKARIRNQQPGDVVTYWIKKGTEQLGPYTYTVDKSGDNPVLIVAAEDYTGANPVYPDPTAPNYLSYYTDALEALGIGYDVWDVDAQGAAPPVDAVLSHYKAAIWYSGDDYFPELNGFRMLADEYVALREYLNYYRGRLFATGQDLPWLATQFGFVPGTNEAMSDDFFQYYLGAYIDVDNGGVDPADGLPYDVAGIAGDPIFDGLSFSLQGGDGANNQAFSSSFLPTSQFLPNFNNTLAATYDRPGSPFAPHTGDFYVYSQQADISYKRLGGTFTLPAGVSTLSFWTSYDIEVNWDFAFVEISEAGSGSWTTLADVNGLTVQTVTTSDGTSNTGESCLSGWVDQLHPHLANYMSAGCQPAGTTGEWNALTGNSSGWQQISVDLSAYAGKTVELYIAYVSDWGTQGLGMFVDDIQFDGQPLESFESGSGNWPAADAPAGSAPSPNNWERIASSGFSEGPAIRTPYSVFLGFGFEGIDTADNRNELMKRILSYLKVKVSNNDDDDDDDDEDDHKTDS